MKMNPELVKELFQKYLNGTCTQEEKDLLEKVFLLHLETQDAAPNETQIKAAAERVRAQLADHIRGEALRKRRRAGYTYLTAAVLLVAVSIGIIFWQLGGRDNNRQPGNLVALDIKPGGNKAILTLADGQTVNLNEAQQGIIVGDGITYADGSSVFNEPENKLTRSLTLTTPKGGTYQITLPDGTHVWLNASSVLKYPTQFAADERVVEIEGEGYFAVKKDQRRPFKVITAGQELMVLGTAFNISAYPDENGTETTLVEGAVKIVGRENERVSKLRPGQQARLSEKGLHVYEVNTEEFTAWKDGYFLFNDANIYSILKEFSRWYDIEIDDQIKLTSDLFTGKIPRNVSLNSALKIVEGTSGMSFQLMDNKLVLSK